jgi:hypothetical protein
MTAFFVWFVRHHPSPMPPEAETLLDELATGRPDNESAKPTWEREADWWKPASDRSRGNPP